MLTNLSEKLFTRNGKLTSFQCKTIVRDVILRIMLASVLTRFVSVEGDTFSLCVLIVGDCESGRNTLVENSFQAVKQSFPFINVDYRLRSICDNHFSKTMEFFEESSNDSTNALIIQLPPKLCPLMQLYHSEYNKPMVNVNCPSVLSPLAISEQSNGTQSLLTLRPSAVSVTNALDAFLKHFQWQDINLIATDEVSGLYFFKSISVQLSSMGYRVNCFNTVSKGSSAGDILAQFEAIKTGKVFVAFVEAKMLEKVLSAWYDTLQRRVTKTALVLVVTSIYDVNIWLQHLRSVNNIYLQNVFLLTPKYTDPALNTTSEVLNQYNRTKHDVYFNVNNANVSIDASLYDAFHILMQAMNSTTTQGTLSDNGQLFLSILDTTVTSPFSEIVINPNGEVFTGYVVLAFSASTGEIYTVLNMNLRTSGELDISVIQGLPWESTLPDPDEYFFNSSPCRASETGNKAELILYILCGLVGVTCIGCVVAYLVRRYLARKEMEKGPNKLLLASTDIVFVHRKNLNRSSKTLAKSTMFEKPDILKASEPSYSMTSLNDYVDFSDTARYNGDLVHVKEIQVKGFEMKSKLMSYLRMLRDLRHENLNPFMGFLNESTRPAVITEFCTRGSLEDVIQNEDIKLDWDFKLSLLTDLVRGLRYVHGSHLKQHGFLKSRNCVIDSRWVLKITDYGMQGILSTCKLTRDLEPSDLLWTAPDLLRDPVLLQKGNDKGDVFSLAIIMQEVILRSRPYSTTGLTPEEIIQKVRKPPPLIRPSVSQQAAPPQYIQLMKQCWAEMPDMRPDIEHVYQQFKSLNHGKKQNIVDTMFKMLEKYSSDLEEIVHNRTTQLEEEKKKTDQLLFRMLPATVAESLKIGRQVEAETFAEVTIYFSDIVGFTTISAMSTPLQVVDLLNDLYTMFDATIDMYDVYKVETIGDAYMVVSGLPTRNGNRHAGEVGTMALDLLSQCGTFVIRHMPEVPLRLRIGLHTGPCVAGVVGLTMPRYCLFGDTVNTASRMESTGGAFRVHLSQKTKDKLDELKGYKTEYRGEVELKGKGMHKTYWLTGKEGFDKPLPTPPDVGEDNHGLGSVLQPPKEGPPKSKSKSNLADIVGAINTLRKAAMGKSKSPKIENSQGKKSNGRIPEKPVTSRPSTEGQVSLTPITLEERDTPPPPSIELSTLQES